MDRLTAAHLCRFSYESGEHDLSGFRYLDDYAEAGIRFCYFQNPADGKYFLAIRGTDFGGRDFESNLRDDLAMLADRGTLLGLQRATMNALEHFEGRYGVCSDAAGHSLGGKLLEFLPDRVKCIALNAYLNRNCSNISSVRVYGDIATLTIVAGESHTDHWIGSETSPVFVMGTASLYGMGIVEAARLHKIDTVISILSAPAVLPIWRVLGGLGAGVGGTVRVTGDISRAALNAVIPAGGGRVVSDAVEDVSAAVFNAVAPPCVKRFFGF